MIRFIPTSTLAVAESLSSALWALSCPVKQTTTRVFSSVTCLDGSSWLMVDTGYSIPVHPEANLGEAIPAILQPWIDEGLLPADTINDLDGLINVSRGHRLVLWDAFPSLFKEQSKTREELIAGGLLASL